MPFFYKHIVPTGLKRGTRGNQIEKRHFCETVFYKQLFSTSRYNYPSCYLIGLGRLNTDFSSKNFSLHPVGVFAGGF